MSEELRGGRNRTGDSKLSSFCYECLCCLLNVLELDGEKGEEGRIDKDGEERGRERYVKHRGCVMEHHHTLMKYLDFFRCHQLMFKSKMLCMGVR